LHCTRTSSGSQFDGQLSEVAYRPRIELVVSKDDEVHGVYQIVQLDTMGTRFDPLRRVDASLQNIAIQFE